MKVLLPHRPGQPIGTFYGNMPANGECFQVDNGYIIIGRTTDKCTGTVVIHQNSCGALACVQFFD